MTEAVQIHPTAVVDDGALVGSGARIWHFCHVMPAAEIGPGCVLGQNVFVGRGVRVGAGTKIQNNVSVYEGVELGERCFVGPSVVFTNVRTPRADVERRDDFAPTVVEDGATIGANATIVCGVRIGAYAFVGAGAVVTADVAPHRLVYGAPARARGWACRCGAVLAPAGGTGDETGTGTDAGTDAADEAGTGETGETGETAWTCRECGRRYEERGGGLVCA